jgi:hypothetical protein
VTVTWNTPELTAEAREVQDALRAATGSAWRVYVFPELPNGEPRIGLTDEGAEEDFAAALDPTEDAWKALLALARRPG